MIVVTRAFLRVVCIVTEEIVLHTDSVISTSDIIVSTMTLSCMHRPVSSSAHMPTHMPTPRCKNQRSLTIISYPHPQTYFQLSSASHLMNLAHSMITVFLCGILRTTLQLTLWKLLGTQLINRILLHTQPACWSCWLCVAAICMDEELVSTTDDINLHVCDPPNVFFKD